MSFLGVLAMTSSLVLVLFDEARAVEVAVNTPTNVRTNQGVRPIQVEVSIPADNLVPIASTAVYLYRGDSSTDPAPSFIGSAACAGSGGCGSPATAGSYGSAITAINADDANPASTYGYFTLDTGYGYAYAPDLNTGYGYGYGYGYGGASGATLSYTILVNPATLGVGHFFVQFIADTGSTTLGEIENDPYAHFEILAPTTTGGGSTGGSSGDDEQGSGNDDDGDDGNQGGGQEKITPTVTVAGGVKTAIARIQNHSESGNALIALSEVDARLEEMELALGEGEDDVELTIKVSDEAFEGATELPAGWAGKAALYLQIELTGGNGNSDRSAKLRFSLTDADLDGQDPKKATMLHFKDGKWVVEQTKYLGLVNGKHTFEANIKGFSPFAVTFDEEAPVISGLRPADGATTGARPLIGATLSDNRGIDTTATELLVDGQKVDATVTATEILYTPAVALTAGTHNVTVRAADESGQTAEQSWSFETLAAEDSVAPTVTVGTPADGSFLNNARPAIAATFADDVGVALPTVTMTLDGEAVEATVTATGVTYTPAADLADGEHTVRVAVEDSSGNGNFAAWAFTVDTAAPVFGSTSPADGASLPAAATTLTADVSDALSGLQTVTMTVDGSAVEATIADGKITYTPASAFSAGKHDVNVDATDKAGNTATKSWSFTSTQSTGDTPTITTDEGGSGMTWVVVVLVLAVIGAIAFFAMRKK